MPGVIDDIIALFERHGSAAYLGERVSQLEHALQAAHLAERAGASSQLIVAALLHDVGHLLDADAADPATMDRDLGHEHSAVSFLRDHFGPAVVRPIELHVAAKRYLCATDASYVTQLSAASVASMRLQGGPMSQEEAQAFRADPFGEDAVKLRRWDDAAKVAGLTTPPLAHFRPHLLECRRQRGEM